MWQLLLNCFLIKVTKEINPIILVPVCRVRPQQRVFILRVMPGVDRETTRVAGEKKLASLRVRSVGV